MQTLNPQLLDDGPLEYAFFESCGIEVFGSADGPFVMRLNNGNNALLMFRANDENIEHVNLKDPLSLFPFVFALRYSASFTVNDGVVSCQIGEVISTGLSYSQAAMRAAVALKNRSQALNNGANDEVRTRRK
jgi:hypothetical protein